MSGLIDSIVGSSNAPVNIFAHGGGGGGGQEFDKLMESRSRVIDFGRFYIPGIDSPSRLSVAI